MTMRWQRAIFAMAARAYSSATGHAAAGAGAAPPSREHPCSAQSKYTSTSTPRSRRATSYAPFIALEGCHDGEVDLLVRFGLQGQVLGEAEVVGAGLIRVDDTLVGPAGCLEPPRRTVRVPRALTTIAKNGVISSALAGQSPVGEPKRLPRSWVTP